MTPEHTRLVCLLLLPSKPSNQSLTYISDRTLWHEQKKIRKQNVRKSGTEEFKTRDTWTDTRTVCLFLLPVFPLRAVTQSSSRINLEVYGYKVRRQRTHRWRLKHMASLHTYTACLFLLLSNLPLCAVSYFSDSTFFGRTRKKKYINTCNVLTHTYCLSVSSLVSCHSKQSVSFARE